MLFQLNRHVVWNMNNKFVQFSGLLKLFSVIYTLRQFKTYVLIAFALLVLFNETVTADESILKMTTGAEYTTGDFGGTQSIDEWYVPFTTTYTADRYTFRLTVPYIRVTAPEGTVQTDGTILPGTGTRTTESGIGDVIAGVSYRDAFNSEVTSGTAVDFTAKVKFGTADVNKGLGTGENDYTIQAELYNYYDRLMSFGILGYKFRGDPPGINLSDSLLIFVGGNYRLTSSLKAGLDFYFQEALFSGIADQKELTAFLGYRLSNTQYLRGYLIQGFGDASPDWGVGVMITIRQ